VVQARIDIGNRLTNSSFDQIVEAAVLDETLQQAAAVNPEDKFELVFRRLLETLFMERMDQNEVIVARFMNDTALRNVITGLLASEAYQRLRGSSVPPAKYQPPRSR
jgi:type I restriction enzyme R subunit